MNAPCKTLEQPQRYPAGAKAALQCVKHGEIQYLSEVTFAPAVSLCCIASHAEPRVRCTMH